MQGWPAGTWGAAVAVLALFGGCLAGPMEQEAPAPASQATSVGGWNLTTLPDGVGAEPSIVAAPDGTLYVAAPATLDDGPVNLAWRSRDGRRWDFLGRVNEEHGSNDASIAVGPDGAVWVATFWSTPNASCFAVSRSVDQGDTWQATGTACGHPFTAAPAGVIADRPWIAADHGGAAVLYDFSTVGAGGGWLVTTSADNLAWSAAEPTPAAGPLTLAGPLAARDGRHTFAWAAGIPSDPRSSTSEDILLYRWLGPDVATSVDGGAWTTVSVAQETIETRYPQAALTANGAVAAWVTLRGDQTVVRWAQESEGTWATPTDIEATGTNAWPWLATSGQHTLLVWERTNTTAPGALAVPADSEWTFQLVLDGMRMQVPGIVHRGPLCAGPGVCDRRAGEFFSATVTPDGRIAIAYADDQGGEDAFALPLRVWTWVPPSQAAGTVTRARKSPNSPTSSRARPGRSST